MINKKKIFQAGSLMIEMVAVIGLIALMTPMLFHQIHRRNEEILNTQIATEIRAVKDAFAAYIAANADTLAVNPDTGVKNEGCSWHANPPIADFFTGDQSIPGLYDYLVCVKWTPINTTAVNGSNNSMPIVYGVVVQSIEEETSLRNAAKVASLIGLEGGVVMGANINGIHDSWHAGFGEGDTHISRNNLFRVAAITSFSELGGTSLLTDVKWNHLRAQTAHADKIFSTSELGTQGVFVVDASTDCILNIGNDSQGIDKDKCTFFKVDATTKDVTINGFMFEKDDAGNPIIKTGIAGPKTTCTATDKPTCEKEPHCVWLPQKTTANGVTTTTHMCVSEYSLNPAGTSLMDDIKLASRSGAKLSEALPKWSLQEVISIPNLGKAGKTIKMPDCPTGYQTAISIFPMYPQTNGLSVNIPKDTNSGDYRAYVEGTYSFAIKPTTGTNAYLAIMKDANASAEEVTITPQIWSLETSTWKTLSDYFEETGHQTTKENLTFNITVHTYCVWWEKMKNDYEPK